ALGVVDRAHATAPSDARHTERADSISRARAVPRVGIGLQQLRRELRGRSLEERAGPRIQPEQPQGLRPQLLGAVRRGYERDARGGGQLECTVEQRIQGARRLRGRPVRHGPPSASRGPEGGRGATATAVASASPYNLPYSHVRALSQS